MEVPRLGVKSDLQLPAYTTATAMPDWGWVSNLYQSSEHHWVFNPLREARDGTCILIDPSLISFHFAMMGSP